MDKAVLVVEDDPDGRELMSRILFRAKIPVELTGTAEDALQVISPEDHAVIIIDLSLPGIDGFVLLEQLRANERTAKIPCIAVTAFHTPTLKQRVISAGFEDYLAKPLDDQRLVEKVIGLRGTFHVESG
jgi:CheY-like chemotaxis protein